LMRRYHRRDEQRQPDHHRRQNEEEPKKQLHRSIWIRTYFVREIPGSRLRLSIA
jgi:hypothetical protein